MSEHRCEQRGCIAPADYRYEWPGKGEMFICEHHSKLCTHVGFAMGYNIRMIPLDRATEMRRERPPSTKRIQ